jgi:hypothetical protein
VELFETKFIFLNKIDAKISSKSLEERGGFLKVYLEGGVIILKRDNRKKHHVFVN